MADADDNARRSEAAVASLYSGPVDDFVRRRDALAKELRSGGDRDAAMAVKLMRKPSRMAWALNLGVQSNPRALAALDTAVAETLEAQARGGDVRGAMATLRTAVRNLASASADAAERAGHRVESSALANAILAALGAPEALDQLRGARLVDVPEGGGLDFLANLPVPTHIAPAAAAPPITAPAPNRAEDTAARQNLRSAAAALAAVRNRAEAAGRALREAVAEMTAAEERARMAEQGLETARSRHDSARRASDAAAAELRQAEAVHAEAQRELDASARATTQGGKKSKS